MENYDKEFEKYLTSFQPRRPRALPSQSTRRKTWPLRVAAATVLACAGVAGLWFAVHARKDPNDPTREVTKKTPGHGELKPNRMSMVQLTKLAVENPEKLDELFAQESKKKISSQQGQESMLRVLAKE